ncbi:MAG: B12-binding domain-containing radical SAM protein [Bacteroidales bacterium]
MKLLFLVPPNVDNLNVLRDSVYGCWCKGNRLGGATVPPHPLVLLATCAKEAGHHVHVIDGLVDPAAPQKVRDIITTVDMVVIQTSVMAFLDDCDVVTWLKELNPQLKSLVVGAMPTFLPQRSMEYAQVDYVIAGEAEQAIGELCSRLDRGELPHGLAGVGFREADGTVVLQGRTPFIHDLDALPFTDWSLLDHGQTYFNPIIEREPYVTELTTRGCFAKCTFCMAPGFYGGKIRGNSAEYILRLLRKYKADGIKEIYFRDEMFTSLKARNRQVFQAMIDEKMDFSWVCSSRANAVDEEDLRLMKKAGCHLIKVGVESGSQEVLDRVKKGVTLEEVRTMFSLCRKIGIKTHAHFMIGNPGETETTVKQTIAFAREIRPTTATFGILTLYPGTPLWDEIAAQRPEVAEQFQLRLKDLHQKSFYPELFTEMTSEQVQAYMATAHRSFFLRPGYMLDRLLDVRSPTQLFKLFKAGSKIIDYALKGGD